MPTQYASSLNFGPAPGVRRPSAKIARLCIQLCFVLAIMVQLSRPEFWAGLMGRLQNADHSNRTIPGTALPDPSQTPARLPAGMILAFGKEEPKTPEPPNQPEPQPGREIPDISSPAGKPIKTPLEDLPFLMESLIDLDRDLPPSLYYHFLDKARQTEIESFLKDARHDITFSHLYKDPKQDPKKYRGQPVALSGIVRRALEFDIPDNAYGLKKRYELWLYTEDSGKFPWVVELTELPPGFPLGTEIQEKVDAAGYFLKLWAYRAQDGFRSAPVLLGHGLRWQRSDIARARFENQFSQALVAFLGLFTIVIGYGLFKWRREDRQLRSNAAALDLTTRRETPPDHLEIQGGVFPEREFDYIVQEEGPQGGETSPLRLS